jgi:phenylacetate-CoA ligase
MNEYGARFLLSYPSSAAWYFGLLADAGLEPPTFEALLLASESVPPEQRAFLEQSGRTRVFTWYGHTERLILAGECEHSTRYHEEPAYGYLELVDDSGDVITEPGRLGEMVGTSFDNRAFPFIRFRTGDWAAWHDSPCVCGRPHRVLERVEGRWGSEYLLSRDGAKLSVSTLNLHGDEYERIRRFQYVQDAPGRATVRLVPAAGFTQADRDRLLKGLSAVTGSKLTWDAALVDRIDLSRSGKHQIVIRHPGQAEPVSSEPGA